MCGTRSACCVSSTDAAGHAGIGAGSVARAGAGFTLIELMWAMTLSLVVMAAVASLFGVFTRSLTAAQAAADLSARLRTAAWRLRQDLTGVTVDLMPPVRPESESGYFEYFEGPCRDAHAKHGYGGWGLVGDVDDVLMFTTRSEGQAFVGRFGDGTIESPVAEVAWFCRPSTVQPLDGMTLFTLYRRQKLVVPYVGRAPFDGTNSTGAASFDLNLHDLSLRLEGNVFIPNSLGDLTKRENRFLREGTAPVPFRFPFAWATGTSFAAGSLGTPPAGSVFSGQLTREFIGAGPNAPLAGVREGDDALLSNILSFDVRVYDPQARPSAGPSVAVVATAGSTRVTYNQQVSQGAGHGVFGLDGVMGAQYFAWKSGSACQSPLFPGTVTVVGNNFADMQDPAVPKTIDLSAAATASGTTGLTFSGPMLQPGDPYWGGPGFLGTGSTFGGYADLAWGGEVKMPLEVHQYDFSRVVDLASITWTAALNTIIQPSFFPPAAGAVGATFPPPGRTAFQSGGQRTWNSGSASALENGLSRTYDTWSTHYEANGVDDDRDGLVDEGTDGVDNNNDGVPDDPDEAETFAPYPVRLRGLEVRIRCYDPASRQIRQTTLRHSFLSR
jgi:prepilin-type N-terminal cleavage/methylation domain-containing protein